MIKSLRQTDNRFLKNIKNSGYSLYVVSSSNFANVNNNGNANNNSAGNSNGVRPDFTTHTIIWTSFHSVEMGKGKERLSLQFVKIDKC